MLLPAGLVLYGGAARRRAAELRVQQGLTQRAFQRSEDANQDLQQRVAELVTLNELSVEVVGTLDRDELIDRSLAAITRHLRFDRALIMRIDEERGVLTGGRSVGGSAEMSARIGELELPVDLPDGLLSRIARADGPLLFRNVDEDPDAGNREIARLLEVTSFLGTPLATKGRTVGVLAVDNRLTGRDVLPGDGPLLYTVGSLIAAGLENARLYEEVEAQKAALERRVAERTAALVDATAAAEAASATKSTFLSSVSHELRTPLTSIVGFSKLISKRLAEVVFPALPVATATDGDEVADAKLARAVRQVSDNLAIIVEEGDRLTALINDTLDLAKIEAGRMEFRTEPVDIAEVISRATSATAALLDGEGGPTLVVEVAPDLPIVSGDRDRLIQVVINLISNAVKFTPTGSITVSAHPGTRRRLDRGRGRRHRGGHPGRRPGARVRALRAGHRHPVRDAPRHGTRPAHLPRDRRPPTVAACGWRARSVPAPRSGSRCRWPRPRPTRQSPHSA